MTSRSRAGGVHPTTCYGGEGGGGVPTLRTMPVEGRLKCTLRILAIDYCCSVFAGLLTPPSRAAQHRGDDSKVWLLPGLQLNAIQPDVLTLIVGDVLCQELANQPPLACLWPCQLFRCNNTDKADAISNRNRPRLQRDDKEEVPRADAQNGNTTLQSDTIQPGREDTDLRLPRDERGRPALLLVVGGDATTKAPPVRSVVATSPVDASPKVTSRAEATGAAGFMAARDRGQAARHTTPCGVVSVLRRSGTRQRIGGRAKHTIHEREGGASVS